MTTTGIRLKSLREMRGWSQEDVAKRIGVGRTTYLKYETGENRPVRKLNELARLFDVSYDYLLDNENAGAGTLSEDETRLICDYRLLDDESKRLVQGIMKRFPTAGNHVVQSNRNGNNYYNAAGIQVNA